MYKDYSDDSTLLQALKDRDLKAYEFLYIKSRNNLLALAISIVNDEEAAKDIVHELFEEFWENNIFQNITISLKSYLYNSVRYKALRYLKGERSFLKIVEDLEAKEENDTLFPLENAELKQQIEDAINKLPPMAGKVFKMHYVKFMSHMEISQQLGISRHTVSNHIDRALKGLREELKKTY